MPKQNLKSNSQEIYTILIFDAGIARLVAQAALRKKGIEKEKRKAQRFKNF